jgi:hypothetical protein
MMSGRVMSWSRTAVAVRLTRGTGAAQTTLLLTGQTAQSSRGASARLAGRRQIRASVRRYLIQKDYCFHGLSWRPGACIAGSGGNVAAGAASGVSRITE